MSDKTKSTPEAWPDPAASTEAVTQALASLATHAWKARSRVRDSDSGEVRGDMKRISRNIEGIFDSLAALGLEVKDHTGQPFDYGLPLKVIATESVPGITREQVIETIRPTIYWRQRMIQAGEVVIATSIKREAPDEQNNH